MEEIWQKTDFHFTKKVLSETFQDFSMSFLGLLGGQGHIQILCDIPKSLYFALDQCGWGASTLARLKIMKMKLQYVKIYFRAA